MRRPLLTPPAKPLTTHIIPMVATMGGTRPFSTSKPFPRPIRPHTTRGTRIETVSPKSGIRNAESVPARPMTAPTETSTPRTIRTIASPSVAIPKTAESSRIVNRLERL